MLLSRLDRAVAAGLLLATCGILGACAAPGPLPPPLPAPLLEPLEGPESAAPRDASPQSSWERRATTRPPPTKEEKKAIAEAPEYELALGASAYIWDEMWLGRMHGERMDRSSRFDAALRYHPAPGPKYDPVVGIYGYFEKREWDEGSADIDYKSYGIGADLGMNISPQGPPRKGDRSLKLTYLPYARLGVGGQDGEFKNIPQRTGTFSSGDFDALRGEAQLGFDIRFHLGHLLGISFGIGADIWGSLPYDAVTRDSTGGIVDADDDLWAWGWGVFGKVGLCIKF